uniref:Uncharacterized protein n=1 Tax=Ananas comosus var. bracteatus TaxID=296719 RepID=A0A6V7P325_ANACO|nr:unnamed protein product [Ananas comosus var. bracteatus]
MAAAAVAPDASGGVLDKEAMDAGVWEVFARFDHNTVAKMEENDIMEISSNKELMLAECRAAREFGSFSTYIWGHVNHKPMVSKFKHPRSVPFRTPKSEAISKDLVRKGFQLVGR